MGLRDLGDAMFYQKPSTKQRMGRHIIMMNAMATVWGHSMAPYCQLSHSKWESIQAFTINSLWLAAKLSQGCTVDSQNTQILFEQSRILLDNLTLAKKFFVLFSVK